jgi:hypothetical protein
MLRTPFCWEGTIGGWWTADIAAAAFGPDVVVETCGRAVVTPETGSALEAGQKPPLVFFFEDQWPESPFVTELEDGCCDVDKVEVEEFEDDTEDDEFARCTLFRCGMNIRETSSALIEFKPPAPPLLLFHPNLDNG